MKDMAPRILLIAAAGAVLALTACQRQEKAAETPAAPPPAEAPAQAAAPAAEEHPMSELTPEQQKMLLASRTVPVCYDQPNCAGTALTGWGVDQTTCNTTNPAGSWREVTVGPLGGYTYGTCHTPPLP